MRLGKPALKAQLVQPDLKVFQERKVIGVIVVQPGRKGCQVLGGKGVA